VASHGTGPMIIADVDDRPPRRQDRLCFAFITDA
jgi:hypothetical protein